MTNKPFQTNNFEQWILKNRGFNPSLFFLILCLGKALLIFLQEEVLGYRADFFVDISSLGDEEASAMISFMWQLKILLGYLSIPIYYALKFSVVGLILWLGAFGFGYKIGFKFLFRLAMTSQIVFFIPDVVKILFFGLVSQEYGIDDFNTFQPLSLVGYLDVKDHSALMINFSEWFSISQFLYLLLLVIGIRLKYRREFNDAFYLVALSFLPASLFWVFFYSVVFS
jgi:hypothetical protein